MGTTSRYLTKAASAVCAALLVALAAPVKSAVPLADTPLFLAVSVPPNITLTLDDSGSMARAWVPENCTNENNDINGCTEQSSRYDKSSTRNLIFYNPNVQYPAPKRADGTALSTSFNRALRNGFDPNGGTVDLSMEYRPTASIHLRSGSRTEVYMPHHADDFTCNTSAKECQYLDPSSARWTTPTLVTACSKSVTTCTGAFSTSNNNNSTVPAPMPAYYYEYDKTVSGCASGTAITSNSCYKLVIVSETSGPGTIDLNGNGVKGDAGDKDERQNFANWYSFARTRNLATITAASLAFADLSPTARVSWQSLNSCRGSSSTLVTTSCKGWMGSPSVSNAVKPFVAAHRNDFYAWLAQLPTNGGTGLPEAMKRAGDYYGTSGENSPYDNDYTTSNSGEYSCRRNYHIMMTDGIWNNAISMGNQDGSTSTLPDTTQYAGIPPYSDDYSGTLADVAFKYWSSDLRSNLKNNLLPINTDQTGPEAAWYWNAKNDPATWQHMVNYTIGLGLSGYLDVTTPKLSYNGTYGGSYPQLALPDSDAAHLDWPRASSSGTAANVADLWHAAINSRGQFFNANDPAALSEAFQSVLTAISGKSGSSASLSANSTSVQPGTTLVYQANFNSDWSGGLTAYPVDASGVGQPLWDASKRIPAPDIRKMYTYNGTSGVLFNSCTNLTDAQQLVLNTDPSSGTVDNLCADRLNWLRGDTSKELRNPGGVFRNRLTTVMGDIINSDPGYVQNIDYKYSGLPTGTPGQATYSSYLAANANRLPMVYVGANDGHMYGIRADQGVPQSGAEQFSYIPAGVFANLNRLTDPAYSHRYYVDGGITVSDAYLGSGWKTVLVAGLNAGGNSIYALDVTDPLNFDESKVMWEFTEHPAAANEPPSTLGLTFSQPQIGILQNNRWVAVFGNGYNSESGGAYLYVVDLETGVLIKKILASEDVTKDESNGLSTPLLVDADGDKLVDSVYAGDLKGNMWKFDLSGAESSWNVAFSGMPLFTARNELGQVQPITSQPKDAGLAIGGRVILFGTGRYLAGTDIPDRNVQTFYGIRDNGAPVTTQNRSELQQQTITIQTDAFGLAVRQISGNEVDWAQKKGWYVDLVDPSGLKAGERVVSTPLVRVDRVIFVTITPSGDVCTPGGTSWLMEVNFSTGGGFDHSILDLNKDGKVDDNDTKDGEYFSGERLDSLGISKTPVLLEHAPGFDKLFTGTTGKIEVVKNDAPAPPPGGIKRRSWIQIR